VETSVYQPGWLSFSGLMKPILISLSVSRIFNRPVGSLDLKVQFMGQNKPDKPDIGQISPA
jgi:hypothetical protein